VDKGRVSKMVVLHHRVPAESAGDDQAGVTLRSGTSGSSWKKLAETRTVQRRCRSAVHPGRQSDRARPIASGARGRRIGRRPCRLSGEPERESASAEHEGCRGNGRTVRKVEPELVLLEHDPRELQDVQVVALVDQDLAGLLLKLVPAVRGGRTTIGRQPGGGPKAQMGRACARRTCSERREWPRLEVGKAV